MIINIIIYCLFVLSRLLFFYPLNVFGKKEAMHLKGRNCVHVPPTLHGCTLTLTIGPVVTRSVRLAHEKEGNACSDGATKETIRKLVELNKRKTPAHHPGVGSGRT